MQNEISSADEVASNSLIKSHWQHVAPFGIYLYSPDMKFFLSYIHVNLFI